MLYLSFRKLFSAHKYLKKSYKLSKILSQNPNNIIHLGQTAHQLGVFYSEIYFIKKANYKFEEALAIKRELVEKDKSKNETELALTLFGISKHYQKNFIIQNSHELAISTMSEAYEIFSKYAKKNKDNSDYYKKFIDIAKEDLIRLKKK